MSLVQVEKSTVINAPPEKVAAFLRRPLNLVKIDRQVKHMRVVEESDRGAVVDLFGVFTIIPYWVRLEIEFQEDGGFIAHRRIGPLKAFDTKFLLRPVEGGTQVIHIEAFDFYELIPGLARPLFEPAVSRVVEEELYRMRRFVEEGWDTEIPWS